MFNSSIDCTLLPPAAVNLQWILCSVGRYLSPPPSPPHTELVPCCSSVAHDLSGVHFRRSTIHCWDVNEDKRTLGNISSVWAWWFPIAKQSGLVILLMPTNSLSVRSLITSHFCWWLHLSSCVYSSKWAWHHITFHTHQLHTSWVGYTSVHPPFIIGLLTWIKAHWVIFPVSGPGNSQGISSQAWSYSQCPPLALVLGFL